MPASKAQRAHTAARRHKAIALKLAGADYQQIADQLGYASRSAAYTDIDRAMKTNIAEQVRSAEVLRHEELARLDRLQVGLWKKATAGEPRAVDSVLRIIDRRCKLLGLDAPVKVNTEGVVRYVIEGADLSKLD